MLRPFHEVIKAWAPRQARILDPMTVINGSWEIVVGAETAQNAQPLRLIGETLHIVTTSSAWSQQLTFLELQIVQALRRYPEIQVVRHLRFRVGHLPRRASARAPSATIKGSVRPFVPETDDQPSCADPLERFRLRCARRRREADHLCTDCGAPHEPSSSFCAPCAGARRQERRRRVERLLFATPNAPYEELSRQCGGLPRVEYEAIRQGLLNRWWEVLERVEQTGKLRSDGFERRIADSYIVLHSGLPLDRISQPAARHLLGDRLYQYLHE